MGSLSFVFILACKMCISFFFISRKKKVELNILRRKSIWDMTLFFVTVMDEPLLCCWVPMSALSCVNNKYQIYWRTGEKRNFPLKVWDNWWCWTTCILLLSGWGGGREKGGEGGEEKIENIRASLAASRQQQCHTATWLSGWEKISHHKYLRS